MRDVIAQNVPYRALLAVEDMSLEKIPTIPNLEVRLIPRAFFPTNGDITVRGNTICLYSYKSAILAIVITSQEIADAMRSMFDLAWKAAEAYPSRKS